MTPENFANREFDVVVTSSVRPQEEIDEEFTGFIQIMNRKSKVKGRIHID